TYIWILDNTKHPDRKGLVQLIDGTSFWTKMRKNLGSKGRQISDADRAKVVRLYADFTDADPDYSKVLRNDVFGYWTITVERPLPYGPPRATTTRTNQNGTGETATLRPSFPSVLAPRGGRAAW